MPEHRSPLVIALGGNAISPAGASGDLAGQFDQTKRTAEVLARLIAEGASLVVTHGNGPQIGNALRRVELAAHEVYPLSLDICVADIQGGMGYMISQCLTNELTRLGFDDPVSTVLTCVEVNADDPAFLSPTKPIGPFYDRVRADAMRRRYDWPMKEVPGRGFRRVVPSPSPRSIVEINTIRRLMEAGHCVIAGGGGGIPVTRTGTGELIGVEAVIDKDLASSLLAQALEASRIVFVTEVPYVCLEYGRPNEKPMRSISTESASRFLADGQFPPGSMGPKIQGAIQFLSHRATTGGEVFVTDVAHLAAALRGEAGTVIAHDVPTQEWDRSDVQRNTNSAA